MFDSRRQAEVVRAQAAIIEVAQMLLPELATYITATSTVSEVIRRNPA
jgi:hypothetical protein